MQSLLVPQKSEHLLTYRTRAIITRGLFTFYPLFEVHLCTVTFGLMYGQYSRAGYSGARTVFHFLLNQKARNSIIVYILYCPAMLIVTLTALILYAAVVPSTLWKTKMKTFHPLNQLQFTSFVLECNTENCRVDEFNANPLSPLTCASVNLTTNYCLWTELYSELIPNGGLALAILVL